MRAVAVVAAILSHSGVNQFAGGFVGVDVFFVISGFLICGIVTRELRNGTFSLPAFYERRIRRILPAFLAVAIVTAIVGPAILLPRDLARTAESLASANGFVANLYFWRHVGYFEHSARLNPLLHTWTLSVEEQFYVLFPLLLLVLHRRSRRWVAWITALTALSLALSIALVARSPGAAFYLTPGRAWELTAGAILAGTIDRARFGPKARICLTGFGLLLIGSSVVRFDASTPFPGAMALIPVGGAIGVLLGGADGGSLISRMLGAAPIAFVGRVSYSWYLWHWPLLAFATYLRARPLAAQEALAMAAAAFVIACASYRWIETPIRRGDALRSRPQLLSAAAASSLVIIGASLVTSQQHGWPSRVPPAVASLADASDDFSRERERCHAHDARAVPYTRACVFGASGAPVRNVIWGDSHGVELSIALGARLRQNGGAVRQSTYSSCSAGGSRRPRRVGGCLRHNAALLRAILEDSVLTTVILVADYPPSEDGKFDSYFVETERVVSALTMGGKRVVLVAPHPTYDFPVPTGVALMVWRGRQPDTGAMAVADFRRRTRESFARLERLRDQGGIELIDPAALLCPGRVCATTMDGRVLYHDELHLSRSGAALVAQLFDSVLGA